MCTKNIGELTYEKIRILIFTRVLGLEGTITDSLLFWRIHVLFSILFVGVFIGFWALLTGFPMMMEKKLWGLFLFDTLLWGLGVVLVVCPGIRFSVRSGVVLAALYGLGVAIIFNVGLLSGGPVALLTFSVLAGVLMGYRAALLSVLVNAGTLALIGYLRFQGIWGQSFAFFDSGPAMVTSMSTFVLMNAMASISVSVLLAGIVRSNEKEKELSASLAKEKKLLTDAQDKLKKEIQEHRRTGEALGKSEKKYRRLFNQAPAGMYEIDFIRFRFVAANDLLCKLSGYSREAFLNMNPVDFLYPEDRGRFMERFERLERGEGVPADVEYRVRGKGGRSLRVLLHSDYMYEEGKLTGARVVVQDLTERKKIEEMMIQSEKMISVGGLAAGMAHEINNPLAGILQNAQVIENRLTRDLPANDKTAADLGTSMPVIRNFMEERGVLIQLDRIKEAGNRAAQIVENMLSFSRKNDTVKRAEDLSTLIDKSLDLVKNDYRLKREYHFRQVALIRECMPGPYPVLCEKTKIQQVIFNIVKNAYQAMADAGQTRPRLVFRLKKAPGKVRMEIEDNGPGMAADVRKRVFEPFFTTKDTGNGTGLGLSVSYFIVVQDHGGEMHVRSKPGRGTRFVITLPSA